MKIQRRIISHLLIEELSRLHERSNVKKGLTLQEGWRHNIIFSSSFFLGYELFPNDRTLW